MIDDVITRLQGQVPDLKRVEGAKRIEDMAEIGRLKHQTPAAFVVPLGLQGRDEQSMSGLFVQNLVESIGVILVIHKASPVSERVLETLDTFIRTVAEALVGWSPGGTIAGAFSLVRGALVPMRDPKTVVYQLDFSINDQLRVPT